MALAVEGPLLEGMLRRLSSTLNEIISLRFRFGTRRPTDITTTITIIINYKKYILKQTPAVKLCRICGKESETIQQITAVCEQLAHTEYVKRHDGLAKIIHQKLEEAAEMTEDKSSYYKYTPANVLENDNLELYWNRSILTDNTMPFNRPDTTFMTKKTKNFFIDIAFPNTHNLAKTITDKQNKYQDLYMCYVEAKRSSSDPDLKII
jgi:hypothetical protein